MNRPTLAMTPLHPPLPLADVPEPICDPSLKFVRLTERRPDGLVAFEFSIGWPELSVELLLPAAAFDEFCATHRVRRLDAQDEHDAGAATPPTEETDA